jgi:nicotinate-nucleotide adenylyltransferase
VNEASPIARDDSLGLPAVSPGTRIGVFGGSFNPAHEAHRAASLLAWKRLALDRVWWVVTPGNPLKDTGRLPAIANRIKQAKAVAASPFIEVTGIEAKMSTRFTYDTVSRLTAQYPLVRFVLLIGADNLAEFHRWRRWRELAELVPIAVVDRAGWTFRAIASPVAHALRGSRIPERSAATLASLPPPAWVFLSGLKSPQSSTALRQSGLAEG